MDMKSQKQKLESKNSLTESRKLIYWIVNEEGEVVSTEILAEYRQCQDSGKLALARTEIGPRLISTVLVPSLSFIGPGPRFETMVFSLCEDDPWQNWSQSYRSKSEALKGHVEVVKELEREARERVKKT